MNICHIASSRVSVSSYLNILSKCSDARWSGHSRCSALWRVAYKLFWIFCGHFCCHVYIHPPTYLLGPVNSLSGLVCECLYICVYFSVFQCCVYVLSVPTHRLGCIGLFVLLGFCILLPTTSHPTACLLIMRQGENFCVTYLCFSKLLQSSPFFHFLFITAEAAQQPILIQNSTYWQMTCVSWKLTK